MFHNFDMLWPSDVEVEMENPDAVSIMKAVRIGCDDGAADMQIEDMFFEDMKCRECSTTRDSSSLPHVDEQFEKLVAVKAENDSRRQKAKNR